LFEQVGMTTRQNPLVNSGKASATDVLILALGNPLRGDDGVGLQVLEALKRCEDLPEGITLLGGDEYDLMAALMTGKYRRVVIVDAADFGGTPGKWTRLTMNGIGYAGVKSRGTLHNISITEVLSLSEALKITLPEIVVYGVQPLNVMWSPALSEPVEKAVEKVCETIFKECLLNQPQSSGERM